MTTRNLRIGDAEREAAITALGEHFAAGRIDKDEYDERSTTAWAAKTAADLAPLFADLPNMHASASKAGAETTRPAGRGSFAPFGPRVAYRAVRFVIIPLAVVLAVLALIPWFVVLIAIWFAWMGVARFAWAPHRR